MRAPIGISLAVAALLVACQGGGPAAVRKPASHPPDLASIAATPTASAPGAASPRPVASAAAIAPKLQKPASGATTLAGSVQIDASYLVAQGAGNIVAAGGGNIVAAGAGNIVAQGGGNAISVGGQIVAQGGGNIIAQGAGNFIGHNGGAIVAQGGGNYHLASADAVKVGTVLPAAGMRVQVYSTRTGSALPLGTGPDGKPVYAVFSNAEGKYEVYIPEAEKGNVVVNVTDPAKNDRRTTYDVIAPASSTAARVDEDSALLTRYIVRSFASRFERVLTLKPADSFGAILGAWESAPDAVKQLVTGELQTVYQLGISAGLDKLPPEVRYAVAYNATVAALGAFDLDSAPPGVGLPPMRPPAADATARSIIQDAVVHFRTAAASAMQQDPHYFDGREFVKRARCGRGYPIVKPTDVIDLWVDEYFGSVDPGTFANLAASMREIEPATRVAFTVPAGVDATQLDVDPTTAAPTPDLASAWAYDVQQASVSLLFKVMQALQDPQGQTYQALAAAVKAPPPKLDPGATDPTLPCAAAASP